MLLHVDTSRVIVGMGCSSWPQSRWPLARLFLCSYCLMAFVGCAGEDALDRLNQAIPERERQKVVALAGAISLDGQPAPNLMVRLVMEGETAPGPTSPKSLTDASGKFEFTTYLAGDGVPTGKYAVIVEQLTKSGTAGWSGPDQPCRAGVGRPHRGVARAVLGAVRQLGRRCDPGLHRRAGR